MTVGLIAKSFDVPDEIMPRGSLARVETIHLGETTANRVTFQPGFRWTEHIAPLAGTDLCEIPHVGYVVSGRAGIRMADGTERELGAGDAFDVPPGHDAWVIGDEPYVAVDFVPMEAVARPSQAETYVPPQHHKILLENDRVRVMELRSKPGEATGMYSHPPCVVYPLTSARMRFSLPDGTTADRDVIQGDAVWSDGGRHDVQNIGTTDEWCLVVELME